MTQPSDTDIAWLAGLFEGEGHIGLSPTSASLTIAMTDRDVIERVQALWPTRRGVRLKRPPANRPSHKDQYVWSEGRKANVTAILRALLPYLGQRRGQRANEALVFLSERPGSGVHMREKTHCPRGHPYSGENLRVRRSACGGIKRNCRTCEKETYNKVYTRHKARLLAQKQAYRLRNKDEINARRRRRFAAERNAR